MRTLLDLVGGESGLLRRYIFASAVLVAFTFGAAQGLIALITMVTPDQTARLSASAAQGSRTYTVTRSVLDDQIQTGSIPRPRGQAVDPCRQ
jgi:uncharacterized membrane protein YcjF (UPF0283 family)